MNAITNAQTRSLWSRWFNPTPEETAAKEHAADERYALYRVGGNPQVLAILRAHPVGSTFTYMGKPMTVIGHNDAYTYTKAYDWNHTREIDVKAGLEAEYLDNAGVLQSTEFQGGKLIALGRVLGDIK